LTVFQCTTAYPCPPEKIGLSLISELKSRCQCPIGLSDHSGTIYPSLAATALGAEMLEVHVTMSKFMFGPDVKASVDIQELAQIVEGSEMIAKAVRYKENKDVLDTQREELKRIFSKSIYIRNPKKAGEILEEEDIAIKKPFVEIEPSYYNKVVGRKLKEDKKSGQALHWYELEE